MNLIFNLSSLMSIQGMEPNWGDFVRKFFKVGLHSDGYRPISFKFGMMIEIIDLSTYWYQFFKIYMRKLCSDFSHKFLNQYYGT